MDNQNYRKPYVSVFCWKCNAQNNSNETATCRQCGCFLKNSSSRESVSNPGWEMSDAKVFIKPAVTILVIIVLVAVGYTVLFKNQMEAIAGTPVASNHPFELAEPDNAPPVVMPSSAWHRRSIWSFFRAYPTVQEIFQKNNQVTSRTLKPSEVQTISLKATMAVASEGCFTDKCLMNEVYSSSVKDLKFYGMNQPAPPARPAAGASPTPAPLSAVGARPKIDDDFNRPAYEDMGSLEMFGKRPDKILRKALVRLNGNQIHAEKTEAFNGVSGWQRKVVSRGESVVESALNGLLGLDLEKLKTSSSSLWQSFNVNEANLTFLRLTRVGNNAHYAVQKIENGKSETLYFDVTSGLLTKVDSDQGTCYLTSYVERGGVIMPSEMYFRSLDESGKLQWMRMKNMEWSFNEPVADAIFDKPLQ